MFDEYGFDFGLFGEVFDLFVVDGVYEGGFFGIVGIV